MAKCAYFVVILQYVISNITHCKWYIADVFVLNELRTCHDFPLN